MFRQSITCKYTLVRTADCLLFYSLCPCTVYYELELSLYDVRYAFICITVKYFENGAEIMKYTSGRDADSLLTFIKR